METGDNVLIGGFIVTGSDSEEVVLRGIGPSLQLAVSDRGVLPDPKIELHDSTGALIASNDNWMDSPDKDAIIALGLAPDNALESALLARIRARKLHHDPERHRWRHRHRAGRTLRRPTPRRANPVNISTRGFVQTGDDVMIGGFIIGGTQSRTIVIRAIGPSLAAPE